MKIKLGVNLYDFLELHPNLLMVIGVIKKHCLEKDLPITITSIKSDRKNIERVSNTHETYRAIDIRSRDWKEKDVLEFVKWANEEFKNIAAITKTGEPLFALYHNNHIHLQVKH